MVIIQPTIQPTIQSTIEATFEMGNRNTKPRQNSKKGKFAKFKKELRRKLERNLAFFEGNFISIWRELSLNIFKKSYFLIYFINIIIAAKNILT